MVTLNKQRGAIGLFAALTLLLAILFAALAVDTGRLMMQHRHLQTVADMAALDASGQAGFCGDGELGAVTTLAEASAVRNNYQGDPLAIRLGQITVQNGLRQFSDANPDNATAVHVQARHTVPASLFAGGLLGAETTLSAEAVAERSALASISAGSTLLSFSTQQSNLLNAILGGILGSNVNLQAVSYEGIADVNLELINLVNASTKVGTVDELLSEQLSISELLTLYLGALNEVNNVSVDAVEGMTALSLINTSISNLEIKLNEVINLTTLNPESAANAVVNLLDLVTTTLIVANGQNAIYLTPSITLLGLTDIAATLKVIEPPQIAIGPPGKDPATGEWRTYVQTAQLELNVQADIGRPLTLLPILLSDVEAKIGLGLKVEVAKGEAWLKQIQCRTHQTPQTIVTVEAQPTLASLGLSDSSGVRVSAVLCPLVVCLFESMKVRLNIAEVGLNLGLLVGRPDISSHDFYVNNQNNADLPQTHRFDTRLGASLGNLLGDANVSLSVVLLNLDILKLIGLDKLLEAPLKLVLAPILSGILKILGDELIDPLLQVLGIEVGIVDVTLLSVEIDRPELKR